MAKRPTQHPRPPRVRAPQWVPICTLVLASLLAASGCGDDAARAWQCVVEDGQQGYAHEIGCAEDFEQLASRPLDSSIPGARSVKTVIDRLDEARLYFQNSGLYPLHYEFVSAELSGSDLPPVPTLSDFNLTEYSSTSRRFLLGILTYYEQPDVWAYEIEPWDQADVEMITQAYDAVAESTYFGDRLFFHPNSDTTEAVAELLPEHVKIVTTTELFEGVDYQALNLGESFGRLRFITAEELETEHVSFRDIVVLDRVPNDISVVVGIVTGEFQTPLSHINVLSQNRGTPNMALRDAHEDETLRALDGKWVRLDVEAFDYAIEEATQDEADAWWEDNKPAEVGVPNLDLETTALRDIDQLALPGEGETLGDAIGRDIPAFGGKATHFGELARIGEQSGFRVPKAFGIPVHYYRAFMDAHGFTARVEAMLRDDAFRDDPAHRDAELKLLRDDMRAAPVDAEFLAQLIEKLDAEYPNVRMRFRSSTNAEDLDGFTGAGLYTSRSACVEDTPERCNAYVEGSNTVEAALREVWSSIWFFRAYEEREYRSIDHTAVGMALLVHRSFPYEEANGVALTENPFDTSGLQPAFYVNVQRGSASVVQPDPGTTTDQMIIHHSVTGQPVQYIGSSSLLPPGQETVLSRSQVNALGDALDAIHDGFRSTYGDGGGWYAMDVEFKFEDDDPRIDPAIALDEPILWVKQARPHPGRGE